MRNKIVVILSVSVLALMIATIVLAVDGASYYNELEDCKNSDKDVEDDDTNSTTTSIDPSPTIASSTPSTTTTEPVIIFV